MYWYDKSNFTDKILASTLEARIEAGDVWMAHPLPVTPREVETAYKDREDATPYDPTYWKDNRLAIEKLIEADRKRMGWKEVV